MPTVMKYIDFPWHEVTAISLRMGFEGPLPTVCSWCWWIEKDWGVQRGSATSDLSVPELTTEDDFIELLAAIPGSMINEDLMSRRSRERTKRIQKSQGLQLENWRDSWHRKWQGGHEEALLVFESQGPKQRTGQEGHGSCSSGSPVPLCYSMRREKELLPRHLWVLSPEVDRTESSKDQNLCHQRQGVLQLALCLLCLILQPHLLPPFLQLVATLLALFTQGQPWMPAVVHFEGTVLYFPTYCTIKLFSLYFLCF